MAVKVCRQIEHAQKMKPKYSLGLAEKQQEVVHCYGSDMQYLLDFLVTCKQGGILDAL